MEELCNEMQIGCQVDRDASLTNISVDETPQSSSTSSRLVEQRSKDHASAHLLLYKNRSRLIEQKVRWRRQVEQLRRKQRQQIHESNRRLNNNSGTESSLSKNADGFPEESVATHHRNEQMDFSNEKHADKPHNTRRWGAPNRNTHTLTNTMMLAEWLLFVPEDFCKSYAMKLVPRGRHVLVLAQHCTTRLVNKAGRVIAQFSSHLPGGGEPVKPHTSSSYYTILDAIYDAHANRIFVLDLLHFNRTDYREMTFEWRNNWLTVFLQSEITTPEVSVSVTTSNSSISAQSISSSSLPLTPSTPSFHLLPAVNCRPKEFASFIAQPAPEFCIDGCLFYYTQAEYEAGATSLVGWLKPYMLREVLGPVMTRTLLAQQQQEEEEVEPDQETVDMSKATTPIEDDGDGDHTRRGKESGTIATTAKRRSNSSDLSALRDVFDGIHEQYLEERPDDYEDFAKDMRKFEEERKRQFESGNKME